jgi:hypothetical protein
MTRRTPVLFVVAVLSLWASRAHAQAPASFNLDPSPRAAALAGASTALFWGNDLDYFTNPALMGYFRGLSYTYQRAQLIPGLSPTVAIQNQPVRLGGAGVGFVFAGEPLGRGNEIRVGADVFDKSDLWGFGISASGVVRTIARATNGETPGWMDRVDVAYGMNFKEAEDNVLGVSDETDATDWGILVRGTPILSEPHQASEFRLDLAYGHSALSQDGGELFGAGVSEVTRDGIAARLSWNPWIRTLSDLPGGWFLEGFFPLLTVGGVADWVDVSGPTDDFETTGQGLEVDLANFVAVRVGHYRDDTGEIEGASWGFGLGLPVGRVGRLQYDTGLFPQSTTLDHRQQHGFTIWLDPIAAWRLRSGS